MTRTHVKDCWRPRTSWSSSSTQARPTGRWARAGENVIRLKNTTGKNIQVVEYSDDPETFIKNVFYNYNVQGVVIENRGNIVHATVTVDPKVKGRAIGKNGRNLKIARDIVNRHHNVQSISVA